MKELEHSKIKTDLAAIIAEPGDFRINDVPIDIPENVCLEVVLTCKYNYYLDIGFGDHYRVLVAIGGVKSIEHGVVRSGIAFALMYYSNSMDLITVDFMSDEWVG